MNSRTPKARRVISPVILDRKPTGPCTASSPKPLERDYQRNLILKLKSAYPNAIVLKLDSSQLQGIPDLLILNGDKWAALEVKRSATANHRPNQDYYVNRMDNMSFARFISPETEEDVLHALRDTFQSD